MSTPPAPPPPSGGAPPPPLSGPYPPGGPYPYVPYAAPFPPGVVLSSKGRRFGAALLDGLLAIVTCGVGWLVWQLVILGSGQTPAKQLMKMRTVSATTGRVLDTGQFALRELVYKLLIGNVTGGLSSLVGAIMVLASEPPKAWWDSATGSLVVDDPNDLLRPRP